MYSTEHTKFGRRKRRCKKLVVERGENTNMQNTQPYLKYASRSQLSSSPCVFVSFSPPHMSIAAAEKYQKYTQLVTTRL